MKRQILFRGWSERLNKWVEGNLMNRFRVNDSMDIESRSNYLSKLAIQVNPESFENCRIYEVHPDSVGLFTGKTDIHGVNVFDGHIDQYGRVVEFSNGSFILTDKKTGDYALLGDCEFIEITGNTFKPE